MYLIKQIQKVEYAKYITKGQNKFVTSLNVQ